MRVLWLLCGLVTACGRIGFSTTDASSSPPNGDGAIPGLPAGFCSTTFTETIPAESQLAIAASHDGILALWAEPSGLIHTLHLSPSLAVLDDKLLAMTDARLGGLTDDGQVYLVKTATGASSHWWWLNYDLTVMGQSAGPIDVLAHNAWASNEARNTFVVADGVGTNLDLRYFLGNGVDAQGLQTAGGTVTSIATDDGPATHGHIAWTTSDGMLHSGNINYGGSPTLGATLSRASTSDEVRMSSGPAGTDMMLLIWHTTQGGINVSYPQGGTANTLTMTGLGEKARFDGTSTFWLAYRDQGVLQFDSYDVSSVHVPHALPFVPVSSDAFELVRVGSTVYLAVLTAEALVLVYAC